MGLFQKDFSGILLKLQVNSVDLSEIVRINVLQSTSVWATSVFIYCNDLAILTY